MFIKEETNRYFAVMKYTPGNAETGIYGDSADIVDVIIANDENEAIEKFSERRDSTILDGSEYVVEINEDEYNQYLNDMEKMTEYESIKKENKKIKLRIKEELNYSEYQKHWDDIVDVDGIKYNYDDIIDALLYMYGLDTTEKAAEAYIKGEFTNREIKRALIYWDVRDLPWKERNVIFDRTCKKLHLENNKPIKNSNAIKEAMYTTKTKTYETEFGPFVIETKEGKAKRRNWSTGKVEWKQTTSTNGYFKDYPSAVVFFLEKDGNDIYVSSSQGNYSEDWEEFVNAKNYGDAIDIVNDEVVKCFQDYYNNKSIY